MQTHKALYISLAGIALIKQYEGCYLSAYLCPANKCTIGYGHVILPKWDADQFNISAVELAELVTASQQRKRLTPVAAHKLIINQQQADELLQKDLNQTALFIDSVVQIALNQNQFDALSSFIFNIGQGNYSTSTLRKKLAIGDFSGAAAEFDRWVMGTVDGQKVKLPGLVKRRAAERALFERAI